MANPPTNYAPATVPYLGTEEWYAYCSGDSPVDRSVSVNGILSAISSLGVVSLDITGTTASSSTTTGALVVAGGAGIAGALNIGGLISTSATGQQMAIGNTTGSTATPSSIVFDSSYSSAPAGTPKIALYGSGGGFGLGLSVGSFDYTAPPGSVHTFYVVTTPILTIAAASVTAAKSVAFPVYTIAQLLALSPSKGWVAWCSDTVGANAMTFHAIIAGSGANTINCQVIYDGTHWLCT